MSSCLDLAQAQPRNNDQMKACGMVMGIYIFFLARNKLALFWPISPHKMLRPCADLKMGTMQNGLGAKNINYIIEEALDNQQLKMGIPYC